jgi:hypothetical protein
MQPIRSCPIQKDTLINKQAAVFTGYMPKLKQGRKEQDNKTYIFKTGNPQQYQHLESQQILS